MSKLSISNSNFKANTAMSKIKQQDIGQLINKLTMLKLHFLNNFEVKGVNSKNKKKGNSTASHKSTF